jgi:ATP-dependent Lon protease
MQDEDGSELDLGPPSQIVVAREVYPDQLPIMALPSRPVFPRVVVPVELESPELKQLVKDVMQSGKRLVGLVLERTVESAPSRPTVQAATTASQEAAAGKTFDGEIYDFGVIAQVLNVSTSDGEMTAVFSALDRMRIVRVLSHTPYMVAEVEYPKDKGAPGDELKAYTLAVINSIKDLVSENPLYKEQLSLLLSEGNFEEPGLLGDMAAFLTSAPGERLQEVLETLDVRRRLERVLGLLKRELEIARLQTKLRDRIEERINEQQREFFLREQLKAIKQELGIEKEGKETELEEFSARLDSRKPSAEAKLRIDDELEKLRMIEPSSAEYALTRNYLDWLTILPWGVASENQVDLKVARQVLERDHYGLQDVKERIVEFVAEGILRADFGGSIICLVGPPGVGKTSIGRSIAECLGRKFYRFSLGGMRDEAEIKGHRRTYIGAMPGKFLQGLRVCQTENPVVMLDEIDKINASYQGDPAAALLEVLDPEQNREFLDHYLDVRYDLSKVLFVCTANRLDTIPAPLLDRMEVISLSGYLLEEKLEIATRYLLPKALKNLKQKRRAISISRPAMRALIDGYAREAGLRNLENQIKKIVRKCAVQMVEGHAGQISIDPQGIEKLLGKPMFTNESLFDEPRPGVIMGLAWTSMGGDTLFIEASGVVTKSAGFKQTGQLGQVMIESSEIAYTHVRKLCREQSNGFFDERFIHLHVPAGAVPKDGPSAGITMATALYTLAFDLLPKRGYAMTGELNLTGLVMPVGGIREKLIAAKRVGARVVLLPKGNEPDFEQLPASIKRGQKVLFVSTFTEVLQLVLDRPKARPARK